MTVFIDSHAHLSSPNVYETSSSLLEMARQAGVVSIVNICTDADTLQKGLALAHEYPWIFNAAATTPHDVTKEGSEVFPLMAAAVRTGQLVAVGETGLDYHYQHSAKEDQQKFLRLYLRLARECSLPVVIHCREAFADFFTILDEEYVQDGQHGPGVLHCFTGTVEEAKQVWERGWYLSLSGIVTFKKSEELRQVAKIAPLDRLLIETDTPYLAPQSKRGKPNQPAYLPEVAAAIAAVRETSLEEIAAATATNARRLFKLP